MKESKPSSWKSCVTCDFWGGSRKPGTFRDKVEYGSNSDLGECIGGPWDKMQKNAFFNCSGWKKWSVLK